MPINPDQLKTLNLSAKQLKELTNWGDHMVNEWLNIIRNIVVVAIEADSLREQVDDNTLKISINIENIETNKQSIITLELKVDDHIANDSAHGVNGTNVGTEDYCELTTGGVVNLAGIVTGLTEIITAPIGAAPAAYDETYTNSVTDLTNENRAKINEIVLKINEIIAGQQTALQMDTL